MDDIQIPAALLAMLPRGWTWEHAERWDSPEDFTAAWAAERRAAELGLVLGPSQSGAPKAGYYHAGYVAKYRNLSQEERLAADAYIVAEFRRGCAVLLLARRPPAPMES